MRTGRKEHVILPIKGIMQVMKNKEKLLAILVSATIVLVMLMTGCEGLPDTGVEDLETEGFISYAMTYYEAYGDEGPEALQSAKFYYLLAIVTNNSDHLVKMAVLTPVAYDKDGNEIKNAFGFISFTDETMSKYKEDKASTVVEYIGAGDRALAFGCFKLADGIDEPARVEWKIDKVYTATGDITSYVGIESSVDEYGASYTITNNSDKDLENVAAELLVVDTDGRFDPSGYQSFDYADEETGEPETLAPGESYEGYIDFALYGIPHGEGSRAELFAKHYDVFD